jgi:hypothetical protein
MSKLDILRATIFTPGVKGRWGLPLALVGDPGIGKTYNIRDLAASFSLDYEELSPGARGEGAFGVIPFPKDNTITYLPPDWALRVNDKAAIVFVDELTTAPPAVQPALLGLIQFGIIGSFTLGSRVRILGAYNPPEIAAAGYELPATVANRMGHIGWNRPSVGDWVDYLSNSNTPQTAEPVSAESEEKRVLSVWGNCYSRAVGEYAGFIYRMPEFLHKMPKREDPQISRAWPSPRSNELAIRALAGSYVHNLAESDRDEFMAAFVGDAAIIEFAAWKKNADLPLPLDLLTGKVTFVHNSKRLDRTVASLSACTVLLSDTKLDGRNDKCEVLWDILKEVSEAGATDLAISTARFLCRKSALLPSPKTIASGRAVLKKIEPLLTASGEV